MTSIPLSDTQKVVVVLAIRGVPIDGFPNPTEDGNFSLGALMAQARKAGEPANHHQSTRLTAIRAWLRAAQKEPFFIGARKLAKELSQATGFVVILGFSESGFPTLEDALEQAFDEGAEKVILVDPKMCRCSKLSREEKAEARQWEEVQQFPDSINFQEPMETAQVVQHLANIVKECAFSPTDEANGEE